MAVVTDVNNRDTVIWPRDQIVIKAAVKQNGGHSSNAESSAQTCPGKEDSKWD